MYASPINEHSQTGRTFLAAELQSVVSRSSTLAERLTGQVTPTGRDRGLAAKRLERWKHLTAGGDEAAFRRVRGVWGLGEVPDEALLPLLGEVEPAPGSDPLRWAALLREIATAISAEFSCNEDSQRIKLPLPQRLVPFAKLYLPIAALARKKVRTTLARPDEWMDAAAWHGLESYLLDRISSVCSLALQPRFLAFKAVRQTGNALAQFENHPSARRTGETASLLDSFMNEQGRGGLVDFFVDHPTAARLTAQVVLFWIEFVDAFISRLTTDADDISERFVAGQPLGKIVRVKAGISDPHRGGRSVLVLHFSRGLRLVYKPRPMQIDAAFSELLLRLNAQGCAPSLPPLAVLAREDHGWEGFVGPSSCRSRREAGRFFQRAGALLYLIHALRGVDFHRENVVATAEGPVLVDLEALFHPPFHDPVMLGQEGGRRWEYDSSVFRTGLLPIPGHRPDRGRYSNFSGFGGSMLQRSPDTDIRWRNVNSDEMEAGLGSKRLVCGAHRARLHGQVLPLRGRSEELVNGFRRMARFCRSKDVSPGRREALFAGLCGLETRLIIRPTFLYAMMIHRSLQPRFLVEGVDRSIEFQALPPSPSSEEYRQAELAAMEVLDVPAFFRVPETSTPSHKTPAGTRADMASQIAAIRASTARR